MNALGRLMREEIVAHGPMRFDRFMQLALYHPEHGYYAKPRAIGRTGDFYTSVSVGPLFGRLLARQFRQMAELLGEEEFWVVEQGAHDGQLARDILEEYRRLPKSNVRWRYLIVEPSPAARKAQALLLSDFGEVQWLERLEDFEGEKPAGVYFSNELVDALPVRLIERAASEWCERCVDLEGEESFAWVVVPITDNEVRDAIRERLLSEVVGYQTEIHLAARSWIRGVTGFLRRGYLVTIDYGYPAAVYDAPFRHAGTLSCYREHHRGSDVLADPGEQDITAHVEFTPLARVGEEAGWPTLGLVDQQRFLTGIVEREPDAMSSEDARAFQTLTHPEHLGSRFQVLVQAKDAPAELAGLRFARGGQLD